MKRLLALPIAAIALAGCQGNLDEKAPLPALDEAYFRCHVQPVLTKNCSALACHGDGRRYFRLFARSRLRYGIKKEEQRNSALRDDERAFNFDAARAFVDEKNPAASLLLNKPLDARAGGYFHVGATRYDQGNVFASRDDADYKVLVAWVFGAKEEDPACIEPGSDF